MICSICKKELESGSNHPHSMYICGDCRKAAMKPTSYFVSNEELDEILKSGKDLAIFGYVDFKSENLQLWLSNGKALTVPFSAFKISGDGTVPDFDDFAIIDHGQTIKLGSYEAALDALV